MFRVYAALGCFNALLSVALGAFGAHGLKDRLPENLLAAYETGVQYHQIHAIGLIALALIAAKIGESSGVRWAGRLLLAGIVLFSGSLYVMSVSGVTALGIITPFGGVAFLAGWLLLGRAVLKYKA